MGDPHGVIRQIKVFYVKIDYEIHLFFRFSLAFFCFPEHAALSFESAGPQAAISSTALLKQRKTLF